VLLTSEPHAWLRPYFSTLKTDPAYRTVAGRSASGALCDLVAAEYPERADWMRQWSPAAQEGTLWLESVTNEKPPVTELELWTTFALHVSRSMIATCRVCRAPTPPPPVARPRPVD